jgi:hypothetical protein
MWASVRPATIGLALAFVINWIANWSRSILPIHIDGDVDQRFEVVREAFR